MRAILDTVLREEMMSSQDAMPTLDFKPLVDTINEDHYDSADAPRAFVHWSMKEVLAAQELSTEMVKEQTQIGGPSDCGVDGWWFEDDQDPPTLHLFQGKYGDTALSESDVDELWRAPNNLLNPLRSKNDEALELARQLRNWLQDGLAFQMHFVTTAPIGGTATSRADQLAHSPDYHLLFEGRDYVIPLDFHLYTTQQLTDIYREHLRVGAQDVPEQLLQMEGDGEVTFKYTQVSRHDNGEKTLSFLCQASRVASIFLGPPKLWTLFKENPRGPLQKYNKQILRSLMDPDMKTRFHALNNGLSVVCDDYLIDEDASVVKVYGMRIVNGCQTTVTLGHAANQGLLDPSVLVFVRLTRTTDPQCRRQIAQANNTQKAVRSIDLASLQDELRHYQQLFEALRPRSYFLEVQAGDWDYMMTSDEKRRFGRRHIEREGLAQAALAFKGMPSQAMEERRYIFQRKHGVDGDPRGRFEDVFGRGCGAEQLLLPWLVLRRVDKKIQQADTARKQAEAAGSTCGDPLSQQECLRYSLLHRTWLVGQVIGRCLNIDFTRTDPERGQAARLCATMDHYFDTVYEVVNECIYETIEILRARMGDNFEGRTVFRRSHATLSTAAGQAGIVPRDTFLAQLHIVLARQNRLATICSALQDALASSP